MSAVLDVPHNGRAGDAPARKPLSKGLFGLVLRGMGCAAGAALVASAFGLWLMPGTRLEPELALMKLGLSLFMLLGGMCVVLLCKGPQARR